MAQSPRFGAMGAEMERIPWWLATLIQAAGEGRVQVYMVTCSLLVTSFRVLIGQETAKVHRNASRAHYDVLNVAIRIAASVLLYCAPCGPDQQSTVLSLAYIAMLSIFRMQASIYYGNFLLQQIVFTSIVTFCLMFVVHVVPLLAVESNARPEYTALTSIVLLFLSICITAITPHDWTTPLENEKPTAVPLYPSREETVSWLDYWCTFGRMTPLITKGWNGRITAQDLATLPWKYQPRILLQNIKRLRQVYKSTARTLLALLWWDLVVAAVSASTFFLAELVNPLGMYNLLGYIANPEKAVFQPYIWLCLIVFGKVFGSIVQQQMAFHSGRATLKLQIALTTEIYSRAMESRELDHDFLRKSSLNSAKRSSTGLLTNLLSTDIKAIMQGRVLIMVIFSGPVGCIVALISLYRIIGWPCLVGLAITFLGPPITAWISDRIAAAEEDAKDAQDARISLSTEYFRSIKIVKYFGWEDAVASQMEAVRDEEQGHLWRLALLSTASEDAAYMLPSLSLFAIFALYSGYLGNPMTASVAYATISLSEIVRDTARDWAIIPRLVRRTRLSMERVDRYLAAATPKDEHPIGTLKIDRATFRRTSSADFKLKDISLEFVAKGLNVVIGPSGSGKTSLLLSILGETVLEHGDVATPDDVAFASQTAWLEAKSLKENILFTSAYNTERYHRVIKACCLDVDLAELPDGDETNIGENGQILSGGQKARVSLARALLSDAALMLLDDIFSALDSTTSIAIWNNVFCSDLMLDKTVVLVTQLPWVAAEGDYVVTMDNGKATGKKNTVTRVPKQFSASSSDEKPSEFVRNTQKNPSEDESDDGSEDETSVQHTKGHGRLQWIEYMGYFGNPFTIFLTVFTLVIYILSEMGTDYWLSAWVDTEDARANRHTAYYLGIYVLLRLFSTFGEGLTYMVFMRGSWIAARTLHSLFVRAVLGTNITWLERTSIGPIMSRLSSDLDSLDQSISEPLKDFFDEIFKAALMLAAVSGILPLIVAPAILLSLVGALVGELYSRAIKFIKNIASSAQSPVISRLSETLSGMAVIRARDNSVQHAFDETIYGLLYDSARAAAAQKDCDQWLKFRIAMLSALINTCAGVLALQATGSKSAGLVAFSLSQASALSRGLLRLVFKLNDLNLAMQSFQRVKEYCSLPPEEDTSRKEKSQPLDPLWPQTSHVEFQNVTVRYTPDGVDILKDVSFTFNAGERNAIVGRTGSGKSTIILSILGFTHIVSGTILYDGVDITTVPRKRLRQAIAMVPQDAQLFQGTLRNNLDPGNVIPEEDLEEALNSCASLSSMQRQDENGSFQGRVTLDTSVSPSGANFSHGQRQVLSLCRAMVRKTKLVLLDEATSSVDMETDSSIQDILRTQVCGGEQKKSGLITVAHRLKTVMDYDKVVVMGFGQVIEAGSPAELLARQGQFYDMVQNSGYTE